MIAWIIYIIVGFILFFVLYLAILGIDRGVKAKNANKSNNSKKKKLVSPENITSELMKLNKLYEVVIIDKKEFNTAKKIIKLT
tara:strand:- start:389 stop:637 length:249 start_codon:yes stop_codon:yes gene_type:complete